MSEVLRFAEVQCEKLRFLQLLTDDPLAKKYRIPFIPFSLENKNLNSAERAATSGRHSAASSLYLRAADFDYKTRLPFLVHSWYNVNENLPERRERMSKYHNDICSSITLANRCYKTDMHASVDFALEQCMFDSLEIEACLRDAPLAAWEADGRVAIVNSIFRIYLICDVRADMIYIAHAAYF